jgi:2Fe-2S ferredoxin
MVVTTGEDVIELEASDGGSLMQALKAAGVGEVLALCGGNCSCATCHVYVEGVDRDCLPPMSREEDDLLEGSFHRRSTSRLACQLPFGPAIDGARVTIALPD